MNPSRDADNDLPEAYTAGGLPLPKIADVLADNDLLERFKEKYDIDPETGCWEWNAAVDEKGYGRFHVAGFMRAAHRVSFALAEHRWPKSDRMVLHSCDNPGCVNPAHLSEGTATDNNREAVEKGRHQNGFTARHKLPHEKGTECWRSGPSEASLRGGSRLSAYDVQTIRQMIPAQKPLPKETVIQTAQQYEVSPAVIESAVLRRTFAWVP